MEARHPDRQRGGRLGGRVHSRSRTRRRPGHQRRGRSRGRLEGSHLRRRGRPEGAQALREEAMTVTFKVNGKSSTVDVAGRHAAPLGAARPPRPQGHEVRLRHRPVRRLHRARQRRADRARASAASRRSPAPKITTIEGLSPDGTHPLQRAWEELDVPQCGYCQAGPAHVGGGAAREERRSRPTPTSTRR